MFDARAAKALSPGQHLTLPDYPGLRLEATQKFRTWVYRYKSPLDGRMKQMKLGQWPAMTHHQAIKEWQTARENREQGMDLAKEKKLRREEQRLADKARVEALKAKRVTVGDLMDAYQANLQQRVSRRTFNTTKGMFKNDCELIRAMPAVAIDRQLAFRFIESHAKFPTKCRKLRGDLARTWDYAIENGDLPETTPNWWRIVYKKKRLRSKGKLKGGEHVGHKVQRALTMSELQLIVPGFYWLSDTMRDALIVYLWTGTRGAEIVQMEGKEVEESDGVLWWTIPLAKIKNRDVEVAMDHRVPLFGRAREVVERRLESYGQGWLFPARNSKSREPHIQQPAIQSAVYNHMPECKLWPNRERPRWPVADWSPHDLRRTVRTHLPALRCPTEIAEIIIGHVIPGVQGAYDKYSYDRERVEWLSLWDSWLEEHVSS